MRRIIVAAMVGLLTACGSSRSQDEVSAGKPAPRPTVVAVEPAEVMPLAERATAQIRMPYSDGDAIAEVGGSIWVKSELGYVMRVDPRTNKVRESYLLDDQGLPFDRHCQGIGTDGTSVWSCATNLKTTPIVRLDAATGKVVEEFAVDKTPDQLKLPYAFDRIWVLTDGGKTLAGLRPGGDIHRLALKQQCAQVATGPEGLVVTCPLDNLVQRIDPESGKVLAETEAPQANVVSAARDDVWVGSTDGLLRLDARTLRRKAVFRELSPQLAGDVLAAPDEVFVRLKGEQFLYRLDPATNEVTEYVKADPNLSSGSVLATQDAIWTTAYDNSLLFRLSR